MDTETAIMKQESAALAVTAALRTVERNLVGFGSAYPADCTIDGRYPLRPATDNLPAGSNWGWTTSFWPGLLWLAHDVTGDARFADAARGHVADFAERIEQRIDTDTHDLGFLYTLACVVPWRRERDDLARRSALLAADALLDRFHERAGIVQAWGDLANPAQRGRAIIDSLMNMPLLYWATEITGDTRYSDAARRHVAALRDHIVRADDSTFHTFIWDAATGHPVRGSTEQGYDDSSCWARGQAWGIYGFALNHRHTGDESFLAAARRCADYFLDHLPEDRIVYWDLIFEDGSGQERDSSAAAIAVCGLQELAGRLPAGEPADRYRCAADDILGSLVRHYSPADGSSDALLLHGVYDKPKLVGVDAGNLWGDYFYLEALARRVQPDRISFW